MVTDERSEAREAFASTVRDFENAHRVPIANNLDAMRRAIEKRPQFDCFSTPMVRPFGSSSAMMPASSLVLRRD